MAQARIYTRTGDAGTTALANGARVSKNDPRLEAYGTIDELNACVGLALTASAPWSEALYPRLSGWLIRVQNDLFNLGSDLATPLDARWKDMHLVGEGEIKTMEGWIDTLQAELPPLREFVLPGGTPLNAALHLCRTVCRRAERALVGLAEAGVEINPRAGAFVNRLSDFFFVAGRWAQLAGGASEHTWKKEGGIAPR